MFFVTISLRLRTSPADSDLVVGYCGHVFLMQEKADVRTTVVETHHLNMNNFMTLDVFFRLWKNGYNQ